MNDLIEVLHRLRTLADSMTAVGDQNAAVTHALADDLEEALQRRRETQFQTSLRA